MTELIIKATSLRTVGAATLLLLGPEKRESLLLVAAANTP